LKKKHWGELEHEEEEEEEVVEQEEEGEEEAPHPSGIETPSGLTTPSGLETPESLELRKAPVRKDDEDDDSNKQLFQVLEQKELSVGNAMFGSAHKYVIPEKKELKNKNKVDLIKSLATEKLDIALNPSEVENMEDLEGVLKKKYEQALAEKREVREDVSSIISEHNKKKRKKESSKSSSKSKKYKDFKF